MEKYIIRKANKNEINNIMQIWLESNTEVHNFIKKNHWQNIYPKVKKNLQPQIAPTDIMKTIT